MGIADFVNVKVNVKGEQKSIKIEKGCTVETGTKRYSVGENGKVSIFNKNTGKTTTSNTIDMTNYQFSTFRAMANNTNEGVGKWALSIADIQKSMEMFRQGKFTQDIKQFLAKGYAPKDSKLRSGENKISTYISSGNVKTSGRVTFSYNNDTMVDSDIKPVSTTGTNVLKNKDIITKPAITHTTKPGEDIIKLARKYEMDTYQIIAANPQLKPGKDYQVKYRKGNLASISCRFKPGTKITIPARYQVKPGSVHNAADVAKITGISKGYIDDLLTVIEVKRSGKPDLTTYNDGFGVPTIGFGHTGRVDGKPLSLNHKITISKAKAYELLANDILKHEAMCIAYLGEKNWQKTPASVKGAILDNAYNKGIWDGFKNPYHNKYTKKIKADLSKNHYASALCDTIRPSGNMGLSRRNVYRFISGLKDLPEIKRKAAMKAFEPYYQQIQRRSKGLDRQYLNTAWNNAKHGKVTGYKIKCDQTDRK